MLLADPVNCRSTVTTPTHLSHKPTTYSSMSRPTTPSIERSSPRSSTTPIGYKHRHQHPHRAHHHHHHDKSVPQSAITGPSSNPFGDFIAKSTSKLEAAAGGSRTPPRQRAGGTTTTTTEDEKVRLREAAGERREKESRLEKEKWKVVERVRARRRAGDEYVKRL